MNQMLPDKDQILNEMVKLTLCRDDAIEWILHSTNEDSEFNIYRTKHHISIHIDNNPYTG